jgi:GT2 family glycosyltransferase
MNSSLNVSSAASEKHSAAPRVSIIIVNFNHKYFPRMCVEAIEKSQTNFDYEIIVVDNNSTDESIEYLRKTQKEGRIHLVEAGSNLGYGRGNNLGVKQARGEFLIISNPDVFVKPDTMQTLLDHLEKHPEIGLIGPRLKYYNGQIQESCRRHMTFADLIIKRTFLRKLPRFKKRLDQYLMNDFDHNHTQEVDLITGAYFMMRKSVYEAVEGFDPRYFLFMEDYDLCRKLHRAGYSIVYYPKAEGEHYHKRLSGGSMLWLFSRKVFWIHLSSALKYFWKWRGKSLKHK